MTESSEPISSDPTQPQATGDIAPPTPDALASVRDLALRAHPGVVPELVQGDSLEALLASIEPASQAYANLAARLGEASPEPTSVAPTPVPAGGSTPAPIDLDRLPTAEKLRRGIGESLRNAR